MTLDEQMYEELHRRAGLGKIRSFNESPVGRRLTHDNLDAGYRRMAQDAKREAEAADWVEGTSEAIVDEAG
jgi:hypothetical protein